MTAVFRPCWIFALECVHYVKCVQDVCEEVVKRTYILREPKEFETGGAVFTFFPKMYNDLHSRTLECITQIEEKEEKTIDWDKQDSQETADVRFPTWSWKR